MTVPEKMAMALRRNAYRTCGGGGYGPPLERAAELVLRDGKVKEKRAREVYGAAVDTATSTVDHEETTRLKGARQ